MFIASQRITFNVEFLDSILIAYYGKCIRSFPTTKEESDFIGLYCGI